MKRLFLLCVCVGLSGLAAAQNTDDYKKAEFFVGYSNEQFDNRPNPRNTLNGVEASGVYNFTRYLGVKGDFSVAHGSHRESFTFGNTTINEKGTRDIYNVLGGIQVKNNSNTGKFKPFAHALFGVAKERLVLSDFQCTPAQLCSAFANDIRDSRTGFAAALGGGLDVRVKGRIQIRVIQIDYNPVRTSFGTFGRKLFRTDHNIRFATGIVF